MKLNCRTWLIQRYFSLPTFCHNCGLLIREPPFLRKKTAARSRNHNSYCLDCAVVLKIVAREDLAKGQRDFDAQRGWSGREAMKPFLDIHVPKSQKSLAQIS